MIAKRTLAAIWTTLMLLGAAPAAAQSGVELFNGTWQASTITVEAGEWPEIAPENVTIAIQGNNRAFDAEWVGVAAGDGTVGWYALEAEFEAADRPGFFETDDLPEILGGEALYWAFSGEDRLVIGRLQIDDDSGHHIVFVYTLTRGEAGLEAELAFSASDTPPGRVHAVLERQ